MRYIHFFGTTNFEGGDYDFYTIVEDNASRADLNRYSRECFEDFALDPKQYWKYEANIAPLKDEMEYDNYLNNYGEHYWEEVSIEDIPASYLST